MNDATFSRWTGPSLPGAPPGASRRDVAVEVVGPTGLHSMLDFDANRGTLRITACEDRSQRAEFALRGPGVLPACWWVARDDGVDGHKVRIYLRGVVIGNHSTALDVIGYTLADQGDDELV